MTDSTTLPFDDLPTSTPPRNRRVFTVTTLTAAIRTMLETTYREIWVEGEISNARVWKTGHLYFTLKDTGAQINAVIFRSTVRYLRFKPENGQHVVARGRVSVYDPKGEYQIVCEHLEPQGLGALQLAFEQLRERLDHEGLFDAGRKRPLPALPKTIGIVTSLDGAAVKDILNVLGRRHPNVHVIISPTRFRVRERPRRSFVRSGTSSASRGSMSSLSPAAAAPLRTSGLSTRSRWPARLRPRTSRWCRASVMRPTSRSAISWRTSEPRHRPPQLSSSSPQRMNSPPGFEAPRTAFAAPSPPDCSGVEPRCSSLKGDPAWRGGPLEWPVMVDTPQSSPIA